MDLYGVFKKKKKILESDVTEGVSSTEGVL